MTHTRRVFYFYLGFHSLLIGIFPFYLPVYFWKQGFGLGEISLFISLSGVGFCFGLAIWDWLRHRLSLSALISMSFGFLIALLCVIIYAPISLLSLLCAGFVYGIYNSFFWTTQRSLFFQLVNTGNTGQKYGNFQIFVAISLQAGIIIGGVLLEKAQMLDVLLVSLSIACIAIFLLLRQRPSYPHTLKRQPRLPLIQVIQFKDNENSRIIFFIDGFYLFLESFFWVITIFLLAHQKFTTLGLIVIVLGGIFAVLFYVLKNSIDRLRKRKIFALAVGLYAASWLLRAITEGNEQLLVLFLMFVMITFCTSFFRLAFNKRFYDIAKETNGHDYLLIKSYYSQFTIALVYGILGLVTLGGKDTQMLLIPLYTFAAGFAVIFFLYGRRRYRHE